LVAAVAAVVLAVVAGLNIGGISLIAGSIFVFFSMNGIIAAMALTTTLKK
jgi:DHA1 family bicyclomycin/chloramphenicol resistance-like MFS transporter